MFFGQSLLESLDGTESFFQTLLLEVLEEIEQKELLTLLGLISLLDLFVEELQGMLLISVFKVCLGHAMQVGEAISLLFKYSLLQQRVIGSVGQLRIHQ